MPGPLALPGKLIFITGPSGIGKTTLCARIAGRLREKGAAVAGFLSIARHDASGEKCALELEDLSRGESWPLAKVVHKGPSDIGPFVFFEGVFQRAERLICEAPTDVVLMVDELGPLELEQGCGWVGVMPRLRRGNYRAALVVVRPALLAAAQGTLVAGRACGVIRVTANNRGALAESIANRLLEGAKSKEAPKGLAAKPRKSGDDWT
jgi:nucleoside-triphosphatase THEP1